MTDKEKQIDEAFDTVNHLIDARADLLYALQRAKEWDALAAMAEDVLADLDTDERLQALIDAAEELADKLMEEHSDG